MVKIIVDGCSEEKKMSEDEHNAKASEVESSAAPIQKRRRQLIQAVSDDEISPAPMEKQPLDDSGLNTSLSLDASEDGSFVARRKKRPRDVYDIDLDEEFKMEAGSGMEHVSDGFYSESDDDVDDDEHFSTFENDHGVLNFGRYSWRRADGLRETYLVNLLDPPREAAKCIGLLAEIGCKDRFVGCSVEYGCAFFAQLNEEEADKMRGLKEIRQVTSCRFLYFDV